MARIPQKRNDKKLIRGRITPSRFVGLELTEDRGALEPEHPVLLKLDSLEITRLYSSDFSGRREGGMTFSIDGQETSISWAATGRKLKNRSKFSSQVLYFGKPHGSVSVEAGIIESDEQVVKALKASQQTLNTLAAVSVQFSGAGAVLAGGAKFLGTILNLIRARVDNDLELLLHGTLGDTGGPGLAVAPLRAGRYAIFRRPKKPADGPADDIRA